MEGPNIKKPQFSYDASGYKLAERWLKKQKVEKSVFDRDGYSIVHYANWLWDKMVAVIEREN